jgi:hypothetical protein
MNTYKLSSRELKNKIFDLLSQKDYKKGLKEICRLPARQAVNPLFSFLFSLDENLKWRSITAFGEVVAPLAKCDMESARIIMRRLMWNLNGVFNYSGFIYPARRKLFGTRSITERGFMGSGPTCLCPIRMYLICGCVSSALSGF